MPWYHEGELIAEGTEGLRDWLGREIWEDGVRKRGCRDDVLFDWLLARALERADAEFGDASRLLGYYYDRHEDWNLTAIVELLGWDVLEDDSTYEELKGGVEFSELEWRDERWQTYRTSRPSSCATRATSTPS